MAGTAFESLFRTVSDGIIVTTTTGLITHFNHAAERALGKSADDVIGKPLICLYEREDNRGNRQILPEKYIDIAALTPNGSTIQDYIYVGPRAVKVNLSPVYDGKGTLQGWVLIFQDERRFEYIYQVLTEARTSITSLRGFCDLLLRGAAGAINAAQEQNLKTIKENLESQSVLIEDVYSIAHIDSEHNRIRLTTIYLNEIIQNILMDITERIHFQQKHITLSTLIKPETLCIEADEEKLTHILSRVIENAFNYTLPNGNVDIHAWVDSKAKNALITVADTGVGIPEAFHDRIWKRFERHDDTTLTLEVPGTGLGLSIAKALVDMHGGDIWFESEVGVGTTFYISLPLEQKKATH